MINIQGYLYITFKHYNTIKKKKHYCMRKVHVMSLVCVCIKYNFFKPNGINRFQKKKIKEPNGINHRAKVAKVPN